ncbi:ORF6N domain-containing protein [Pseudoflavonifractor sp. 524-17]|nr:ORF6N domain-containing protein [Pseudoflavonifractor sp. 524-17]
MSEIAIYTQAQSLAVKEYQGERVITFKDVDILHQRVVVSH